MLSIAHSSKGRSRTVFLLPPAILLAMFSGPLIAAAQTNTGLGSGALAGNTGNYDTGLGYFALPSGNSADFNTATGAYTLYRNTTGAKNTATGAGALFMNTMGNANTATGQDALENNSTGSSNTATGVQALFANSTGTLNSAVGAQALINNTTGSENTASGAQAMFYNGDGGFNTATGFAALRTNGSGSGNTATGADSLKGNNGYDNTATGVGSLQSNTTGSYNTGDGSTALFENTTGILNTATGINALFYNQTGSYNTAAGGGALLNNTGSNNIALGYKAGNNLTAGGNNIDIGNLGVAAESRTIRIGAPGTQTATYIAGISGAAVTGGDVVVNSSGRLGVVASSARFKRDIRDMGALSDRLMKLRPVTFRYRDDPHGIRQYGLIAEEVERVYPELVTYGADGKVETVRYSMLTSMLLNELQKQALTIRNQNRDKEQRALQIKQQAQQIRALSAQIAEEKAIRQRELGALRTAFAERLTKLEQAASGHQRPRDLAAAFAK
jgi:hypothetical protein